jgi:hypothetical protein
MACNVRSYAAQLLLQLFCVTDPALARYNSAASQYMRNTATTRKGTIGYIIRLGIAPIAFAAT